MKFVVPLTIPNTFDISVTPKLSWITRMIGITPATAASKRSWTPASRARANSSSPCCASSCLFAVTTGLAASSARLTYSSAGSVPPISSTMTSEEERICSKSPSERFRTPVRSGRRPVAAATASARSASSSANALPTVPRPSRPIRTGSLIPCGQVLVGLAPDDDARVASAAEDHRRPRDGVVIVRHRVTVGPRRRRDEDVADGRRGEARVANEDVARLAVHAGDRRRRIRRSGGTVSDQRLVAGAVKHRAQVVRHAAVDRDVGAHAGNLLHGPDAVGGDPGVADQRAAGLDQNPRRGAEDLGHAAHLDVDVGLDRGRLVLFRVGDPESAADVDELAPVTGKLAERADRKFVGLELEDLRADVGVQADELEMLAVQHALDRPRGEAVLEAEAELRVELPGLHVVVGRRPHAGGHPDQHGLAPLEQALAALDLVERVDDQVPDARAGGESDLLVGLVVAVQVDASAVETGPQRRVQLAARGDVDRQALLAEQPAGGGAGERLARVDHLEAIAALLERLQVGACPRPHIVLGVD